MAALEIRKENTITTGNMKLFVCNFCNECYSQERSFKLHIRAHKSFTCETCGQKFSLKRDLTFHLRAHEAAKNLVCDVCFQVFKFKVRLKMHRRAYNHYKSHVCDVCKSTFNSEITLQQHYTTHTAAERPVCDTQQASFQEKSSLQTHSCTLSAEKPSNSDETVRGSKKRKLKQTIRKDEEQHEWDTECDVFQKTFRRKTVKKHRDRKGEKSRVSDVSERAFNELSSSNTFPLSSLREKPHVCNLCQTAFSRKSSLLSHSCTTKKKD